jgi:hypothetical protein
MEAIKNILLSPKLTQANYRQIIAKVGSVPNKTLQVTSPGKDHVIKYTHSLVQQKNLTEGTPQYSFRVKIETTVFATNDNPQKEASVIFEDRNLDGTPDYYWDAYGAIDQNLVRLRYNTPHYQEYFDLWLLSLPDLQKNTKS